MTGRRAQVATLALLITLARASAAQTDTQAVAGIESEVRESRTQLGFVRDLIERGDISSLERAKQLFNESETQFLLENYEGAAAGLLEAVSVPRYRSEPTYVQALYYLAEALFKTNNFVESKQYFEQAVALMKPGKDSRYQDCIVRLIHLSDLTNDASGIERFYDAALKAGALRPEVIYLYAKWEANRPDLPVAERMAQADGDFARIRPGQAFYGEASYYRGAMDVEQGRLDAAIPFFEAAAQVPVPDDNSRTRRLHDLAVLGVARVLAEQGKYSKALTQYHKLPSDSDQYVDALFERTEVLVRKGNIDEALRTADTLVVLAKDTPVEPDAEILYANLLLKLGKSNHDNYDRATDAFKDVKKSYNVAREDVQAILDHPDPVKYFNDLFRREGATDLTHELPRLAQGFVDPTAEVRVATGIQHELTVSRKDIAYSDALAEKLLAVLSKGGLDTFPQLRDANSRSVQLSNTLIRVENDIVRLQIKLLGDHLPSSTKSKLDGMEAARANLDRQFQQLPQNQDAYDRRLQGFREHLTKLETELFTVERTIASYKATLNADETWWRQMLPQRHVSPERIAEDQKDFEQWHRLLEQFETRRAEIEKEVTDQKSHVFELATGGQQEERLREAYHQQLTQMQAILSSVMPSVSAENRPLLDRLNAARADIDRQQTVLSQLRLDLRSKATEMADGFRKSILFEQGKLSGYHAALAGFGPQSEDLIGRIAVDAFKQVRDQLKNIVIKADVGIIDVAWTRKQEHTDEITKAGKEREQALKQMQDRYKEVLSDVQ